MRTPFEVKSIILDVAIRRGGAQLFPATDALASKLTVRRNKYWIWKWVDKWKVGLNELNGNLQVTPTEHNSRSCVFCVCPAALKISATDNISVVHTEIAYDLCYLSNS